MKNRSKLFALFACVALLSAVSLNALANRRAGDKEIDVQGAWDALKTLEGTWVANQPGPDGKNGEVVFKATAGGSMLMETMFPGDKHEMINTYHLDGERLLVTHYCAQGVQPRMKLTGFDNGVIKFEFLDCTNMKPGEGHMGGLEISINGEQMVEKWSYLKDGKVAGETPFEFTKKN